MSTFPLSLQAFGNVPFSHGALLPLLSRYRRPNDKIAALLAKGDLLQLRRGLYVLGPEHRGVPMSLPLVANVLFGPSMVSLDFALAWHGLIPEAVVELTSVTPKRSRTYDTALGRFSYLRLPLAWYRIGLRMETTPQGSSFLMASGEKALCDKVLLTRNLKATNPTDMRAFLLEDLRLDVDAVEDFDLGIFEQCRATGHKPRQMAALCKAVEALHDSP